jgi:hypothetical protein
VTREELFQTVNDEITVSGSLPYSIPAKELERLLAQAENWFYVNYGPSVETTYYVLPRNLFASSEWKATRSVALPDCVVSIQDVRDFTGGGILGTVDQDFSDNRLIASELFLSPFQSDDLVLRTAQYSYWDLTKAFILERYAFDFNRNTKRLKILGRDPKKNVFILCYTKIEPYKLYDDWFFQRYMTAQAKMSLGRLLGTFTFNLPGGIAVDASSLKDEGKEELEQIKQQIDDENAPDWFYIFH